MLIALTGSRPPPASSSLGEVQRFHDALDHPAAVIGVEDVEAGTKTCDFGGGAKLSRAEPMKRPEPVRRRLIAEGGADAVGHVARGLVGEGGDEQARGRKLLDLDLVDHRGREGRGLTCPGARENQG